MIHRTTISMNDLEKELLESIQAVVRAEHPHQGGASATIADALLAYAVSLLQRHQFDKGIPPRTQAKLDELAKALEVYDERVRA